MRLFLKQRSANVTGVDVQLGMAGRRETRLEALYEVTRKRIDLFLCESILDCRKAPANAIEHHLPQLDGVKGGRCSGTWMILAR